MPVKIFVGNISEVSEAELKELFEKYGTVNECATLGKFGFVHMENEEDGKQAIKELNNTKYKGHFIYVMLSKKKDANNSGQHFDQGDAGRHLAGLTKIFVGNIKQSTTNAELKLLFEAYGDVAQADVCGSFGFVHMTNLESALHAIKALQGYYLNGSNLSVELSTKNTQGRRKAELNCNEFELPPSGPIRTHPSFYIPRNNPYNAIREQRMMDRVNFSQLPGTLPTNVLPPVHNFTAGNKSVDNDSFAKELLRLYLNNPVAFDRYARDPQVQLALNIDSSPAVPIDSDIKESFYNNDFNYYEPNEQSDRFTNYR